MEPITTTAVALAIWEIAIKPVTQSIQDDYGDYVKSIIKENIKSIKTKIPFNNSEIDIIEAEIVKENNKHFIDEKNFLSYTNSNKKIIEALEEFIKREPNFDLEKSTLDVNNININNSKIGNIVTGNNPVINQNF